MTAIPLIMTSTPEAAELHALTSYLIGQVRGAAYVEYHLSNEPGRYLNGSITVSTPDGLAGIWVTSDPAQGGVTVQHAVRLEDGEVIPVGSARLMDLADVAPYILGYVRYAQAPEPEPAPEPARPPRPSLDEFPALAKARALALALVAAEGLSHDELAERIKSSPLYLGTVGQKYSNMTHDSARKLITDSVIQWNKKLGRWVPVLSEHKARAVVAALA